MIRQLLAALTVAAAVSGAQEPIPAAALDSQAVRLMVSTMSSELADKVAAVAKGDATKPWVIDFPQDTPVNWIPFRAPMMRAVNGREAVAGKDSLVDVTSLAHLALSGDTLSFNVQVGIEWMCEGHWRGKGTGTTYTMVRSLGTWSAPVRAKRDLFSSDPCKQP